MNQFIISNGISILIGALFFAYLIFLMVTSQWTRLRETAYKIMLAAEKIYAAGHGRKKFNYVFINVYNLIPAWIKIFISEEYLRNRLQEWYLLAKDYVDNGRVDSSAK